MNEVKVTVLKKLQKEGIDFSKDYFEQPAHKLDIIRKAWQDIHYRQSKTAKASGKTGWQSFYYSIQNLAEKLDKLKTENNKAK